MIAESYILYFFEKILKSQIDVILMRNIGNELPGSLRHNKDIDFLIRSDHVFEDFLVNEGFEEVPHPNSNDLFLYGIKPFKFYFNKKTSLYIDLHYKICCRSLNMGEWIPLDVAIQDSAWANKRVINNGAFSYLALSGPDELVSLIARSVFDKKCFSEKYKKRIVELQNEVNLIDLMPKLSLIFFKYAPKLCEHLKEENFDVIYTDYLRFKEY